VPTRPDTHTAVDAKSALKQPWYLREVPRPVLVLLASPLILIALPFAAALCAIPGLAFVSLFDSSSIHHPTLMHWIMAAALGGLTWAVFFRLMFIVSKWLALGGGFRKQDRNQRPPNA